MSRLLRFCLPVLFIATAANAQDTPEERVIDPTKMAEILKPRDGDILVGDPNAPVVLIEYSSLSCTHCAKFHNQTLPPLKEEFIEPGKVLFINRDFPLNAPALSASMVVQCAPEERRAKFQEVLFKMQDKWAFSSTFIAALKKIAAVGGMSGETFDACMVNKDLETEILELRKEASDHLPIDGTPAFFLNGKPLKTGRNVENFRAALQAELNLTKTP